MLFFNPGDQNWWLGISSNNLNPNQSKNTNNALFNGVNVIRNKLNNIVLVYVNNGNANQSVSVS